MTRARGGGSERGALPFAPHIPDAAVARAGTSHAGQQTHCFR
ncbi:hypothetical protein [Tomitella cavernea]|nr:hypothetical protein [Tomitella cavernea]